MYSFYDMLPVAQQGGQQDQVMQIIQMYAKMQGVDPRQIMQQLKQMQPQDQQKALQQISQVVQQQGQQQGQMMASGGSVVDFLNSKKLDSSKAARKQLAEKYGIANYTGSSTQNLKLLNLLQSAEKNNKSDSSFITNNPITFQGIKKVMQLPLVTNKEALLPEDVINQYRKVYGKNSNKKFGVVSKKNAQGYFFDQNGNLALSDEVGLGKDRGDEQPIFYKKMTTPSGEYTLKRETAYTPEYIAKNYGSKNMFIMKHTDPEKVLLPPSDRPNLIVAPALHGIPTNLVGERLPKFNNNNLEDNLMSAGCVNCKKETLDNPYFNDIISSMMYVLPESEVLQEGYQKKYGGLSYFDEGGVTPEELLKKARLAKTVPQGYVNMGKVDNRTLYGKTTMTPAMGGLKPAMSGSNSGQNPEQYNQKMISMVQQGYSPEDLAKQGYISKENISKYSPYYTAPQTQQDFLYTEEDKPIPFSYADEFKGTTYYTPEGAARFRGRWKVQPQNTDYYEMYQMDNRGNRTGTYRVPNDVWYNKYTRDGYDKIFSEEGLEQYRIPDYKKMGGMIPRAEVGMSLYGPGENMSMIAPEMLSQPMTPEMPVVPEMVTNIIPPPMVSNNVPTVININQPLKKAKTTGLGTEVSSTHNNPLNIHFSKFAKKYDGLKGANDVGGNVAVFPSLETGIQAGKDLLFGKTYNNLTITQARNKWVTGSPDRQSDSSISILKEMKVSPYTKLSELTPAQKDKLFKQFAKWEGRQGYNTIKNIPLFEYGGIHINPANEGKFTASANRAGMGVQQFASQVLANKEDYSPLQVKRANFARNAAGWNHEGGGHTEGSIMDVSPEQMDQLRQQGYQFEILN